MHGDNLANVTLHYNIRYGKNLKVALLPKIENHNRKKAI